MPVMAFAAAAAAAASTALCVQLYVLLHAPDLVMH
jgi:hypothetical protein